MVPSKFESRVKLAALARVNPGSMYNPSRERWLCSCVTFICAFVGTIAPNKPAATSEETESESFNAAHSRFRHRQREVKLFIRISGLLCGILLKADDRQNELRPNHLLAVQCRGGCPQPHVCA